MAEKRDKELMYNLMNSIVGQARSIVRNVLKTVVLYTQFVTRKRSVYAQPISETA